MKGETMIIKKKKGLLFMSLLFAISFIFSAALASITGQAEEADGNDQTYLIATDVTFAPFEFQNEDGEYIGIDMDLLAAIAEDQGFEYELRPMNFSAGLQ